MNNIKKISRFIVKYVQEHALFNGFQYCVSFEIINTHFNISIDEHLVSSIYNQLLSEVEVADCVLDDGFDVVLFTNYAPNYDCEDYY